MQSALMAQFNQQPRRARFSMEFPFLPMNFLKSPFQTLKDGLVRSQSIGLIAAASVALIGQIENGDGTTPLNNVSHIAWGDDGFDQSELSVKYTGSALALNQVSVMSWALLHEWIFGKARDEGRWGVSLAGGILVSALAYVVDFKLAPDRYKPGFERLLSSRGLLAVYLLLALALGWGRAKN